MRTLEQVDVLSPNDKELLLDVKKGVQQLLPTAQVVAYGSVARGTRGAESDYDILVLTDQPLCTREQEEVWGQVYELELAAALVISVQFCAKAEWETPFNKITPFHDEVERDGIVL